MVQAGQCRLNLSGAELKDLVKYLPLHYGAKAGD